MPETYTGGKDHQIFYRIRAKVNVLLPGRVQLVVQRGATPATRSAAAIRSPSRRRPASSASAFSCRTACALAWDQLYQHTIVRRIRAGPNHAIQPTDHARAAHRDCRAPIRSGASRRHAGAGATPRPQHAGGRAGLPSVRAGGAEGRAWCARVLRDVCERGSLRRAPRLPPMRPGSGRRGRLMSPRPTCASCARWRRSTWARSCAAAQCWNGTPSFWRRSRRQGSRSSTTSWIGISPNPS